MSYFQTENLRTLALVGHGSCGKTTLIEAMLYRSGMIPEPGTVERGNTMCDNDALEKEVGHSIRLAVAHIDTAMPNLTPVRIHVLDTPGYPDYIGQDLSALDAVKSVAAVIDATKGVDLFTQRMMDMAAERKLCRMIVVNKFDVPEANLEELLAEMQAIWGPGVLPINLPTQNHAHVIDCFEREEGESDIMSVADVHRAFIERIVEEDDEQLERYLEQGSVDPRTLHPLITKALREGHIIPVCFVSAKNLIGIRDFMKVIIRHLPSPAEANEALFVRGDGEPFATKPDKDAPVIAQVFKIVNDPYIGKIGVFRVHQGQITKDSVLYVDDNKKPIKIAHPLILQGKNTAETDVLTSGDIGAAAKIDELRYGSVLHSDPEHSDVRMRPIRFPKPMFGLAIRPARRGDESRLSDALNKMLAEDPTMEVDHDVVLNETVIRGITEMHVRSILERMKLHFKVEVETTAPSIPYRETISQPAEGPPQEADGRRRSVRRSLSARRTARTRQGLRIRRPGKGRRDSVQPDPRRGKGRARSARHGLPRGLSPAGPARDGLRRQAPPRRLEGSRLRVGRPQGFPRRARQGRAADSRTDRPRGNRRAGKLHGRHRRRSREPPRSGFGHRQSARRSDGNHGHRSARRT